MNFEVLLADAFYKQQSNPFEEDKNPEVQTTLTFISNAGLVYNTIYVIYFWKFNRYWVFLA